MLRGVDIGIHPVSGVGMAVSNWDSIRNRVSLCAVCCLAGYGHPHPSCRPILPVFAKALELAQRCLQMALPLHWVRLTPFASTGSGVPLLRKAWRAQLQGVWSDCRVIILGASSHKSPPAIRTPPVAPRCRRCLQVALPLHWVRLTPFASTGSGVPLLRKAWRAQLQGV
jgi:hypothetical protein